MSSIGTEQSGNIRKLIYTSTLVMLVQSLTMVCKQITAVQLQQQKIQDHLYYLHFLYVGALLIHYFLGPFMILAFGYLLKKLLFRYRMIYSTRFLFFVTALTKIVTVLIGYVLSQADDKSLSTTIIIVSIEILLAPAQSLYFCSFNYYVNSLSSYDNKGLYYGLAYAIFCSSGFIAAILDKATSAQGDSQKYILTVLCFVVCILFWCIQEGRQIGRVSLQSSKAIENDRLMIANSNLESKESLKSVKFSTNYQNLRNNLVNIPDFKYLVTNIIVLSAYQSLTTLYLYQLKVKVDNTNPKSEIQMYRGTGMVLGGIISGILTDNVGTLRTILFNQLFAILILVGQLLAIIYLQQTHYFFAILQMYAFFMGVLFSTLLSCTSSLIASQYDEYPQIIAIVIWIYCWGYGCVSQLYWIHDESNYIMIPFCLVLTVANMISLKTYWGNQKMSTKLFVD